MRVSAWNNEQLVGTIGLRDLLPYVNRWIVRFVFDFGAELLMRLLLGKIFVQKNYWRKSGNISTSDTFL